MNAATFITKICRQYMHDMFVGDCASYDTERFARAIIVLTEALEHYVSSHYDVRGGGACSHDKTAEGAITEAANILDGRL